MTVYVLSKMTNGVSYRNYRLVGDANSKQGALPVPTDTVIIRGGADRPSQKGGFGEAAEDFNGNVLWTPRGVVTKLTDEEYDRVKEHWLFKKHLAGGYLAIVDSNTADNHKKITRVVEDMEGQDPAAQLTKSTVAQRIKVKTPVKEIEQGY
jgi:hypothetical protein